MGEFPDESALLRPYRVCGLSGGQVASKAISRPERHTDCIEYLADGTAGGTVCRCYQLCRRTVVCTSIQHRGQRIPYYVMEQPYRAFIELFFYNRRQIEQQRRLALMEKEKHFTTSRR